MFTQLFSPPSLHGRSWGATLAGDSGASQDFSVAEFLTPSPMPMALLSSWFSEK